MKWRCEHTLRVPPLRSSCGRRVIVGGRNRSGMPFRRLLLTTACLLQSATAGWIHHERAINWTAYAAAIAQRIPRRLGVHWASGAEEPREYRYLCHNGARGLAAADAARSRTGRAWSWIDDLRAESGPAFLEPARLSSALGNGELHFMGDSLNLEMYASLIGLLHETMGEHGVVTTPPWAPDHWNPAPWSKTQHGGMLRWWPLSLIPSSDRELGAYLKNDGSQRERLARLLAHQVRHPRSVLVLSAPAVDVDRWTAGWQDTGSFRSFIQAHRDSDADVEVRQLARQVGRVLRQHFAGSAVVYVAWAGGHPGCDAASAPYRDRNDSSAINSGRSFERSWLNFPRLNSQLVQGLQDGLNENDPSLPPARFCFKVLDVQALTMLRPDAHSVEFLRKRRTGQQLKNQSSMCAPREHGHKCTSKDCLHYCLPGGPIETWNDELYRLLMDSSTDCSLSGADYPRHLRSHRPHRSHLRYDRIVVTFLLVMGCCAGCLHGTSRLCSRSRGRGGSI